MYQCERIFVNGDWRNSASGTRIDVINPYTEQVIGNAVDATAADVDAAVTAAHQALKAWSRTPLEKRIEIVQRIANGLKERRLELGEINTKCVGFPFSQTPGLSGALDLIDMYIETIKKIDLEYLRCDRHGNALIERRPVGVVAGIVPWNAPIRSEVKKAIPALLSGCTVVLKTAPETPFGGAIFAEICSKSGLPAGVLNLVPGGRETGEALVKHSLVRKIAFTGSSATGARIASLAAPQFKRLQLELGGKSAAIVLDDADLNMAVPMLAAGAWANNGEACASLTRILVPRKRKDELVERMVQAARGCVLGDPMDQKTTMGPLFAKRHFDRVAKYIEIGRNEGARVMTGGGRPSNLNHGYFIEPTIFDNVENGMTIAREEIFGPVSSVISYDSEDEAVAIANDCSYGLHGAVFSGDNGRALDVASKLDTGTVGVNRVFTPACAPFGGLKASGIGREHGPEGYDSFLEYVSYTVSPEQAEQLKRRLPAR